mmetsp:Transcript_46105/g.130760  ORF Transcript_46105/g.130760 Transcript_46105/m.130760 type:complete len:485 (+) Transcript_46105:69-1523(+)
MEVSHTWSEPCAACCAPMLAMLHTWCRGLVGERKSRLRRFGRTPRSCFAIVALIVLVLTIEAWDRVWFGFGARRPPWSRLLTVRCSAREQCLQESAVRGGPSSASGRLPLRRYLLAASGAAAAFWLGRGGHSDHVNAEPLAGFSDDPDIDFGVATVRLKNPPCRAGGCGKIRATIKCPSLRTEGVRFPLVIFSGGFATESSEYTSLVTEVALGGCAVLQYDMPDAFEATDLALVAVVRSLLNQVASAPELRSFVDASRPLLVGHSRGAKIASLAAVADDRVAGLCLLDPVDNTIWAPVSPGFPSACDALRAAERPLPVAIVGAGAGGDCAPAEANFRKFFDAVGRPSWLLVIPAAGHAQFLDPEGMGSLQKAVCRGSSDGGLNGTAVDDAVVKAVAAAACLAWADLTCGPLVQAPPKGTKKALPQLNSWEGVTARLEVKRRLQRRPSSAPAAQADLTIAVGAAASVTVDWLSEQGLEVESYLNL